MITENHKTMIDVLKQKGVVGDGNHDDTVGLQAALDSGATTVSLPCPLRNYLISKTLRIHSGQTMLADRNAVIRLADHAHAHMLTNADHEQGNKNISVIGGIWDGNNEHQTCEYHQTGKWQVPYDPVRYLGEIMQFNNVTDLRVAGLTLKDPEAFGFAAGNLRRFTVEDITFDYNLRRNNMDGIHIHGNSHQGRIVNLKGTTNDDFVALCADDGSMFELSRGPITDILVDGLWSEDSFSGVRLLSAGSPVQRIKISNIFGAFRAHAVAFTNHAVHPGEASTFDDISIDGMFCRKPEKCYGSVQSPDSPSCPYGRQCWQLCKHVSVQAPDGDGPESIHSGSLSLVLIQAPAIISNLSIRDYHRTETAMPADDIHIQPGAYVDNLLLDGMTVSNRSGNPIIMLHNCGKIENLGLQHVRAITGGSVVDIIKNEGTIGHIERTN